MRNYEDIVTRSERQELSDSELDEIAEELTKPNPEESEYRLLYIIGRSFGFQYRYLVEKFLQREDDPMLVALAMQILCLWWNETKKYYHLVVKYINNNKFDYMNDCRRVAIDIAGEYLRKNQSRELLKELIEIFEATQENQSVRQEAYGALMRALGYPYKEMPSAADYIDLVKDINPAVLLEAKTRLVSEMND